MRFLRVVQFGAALVVASIIAFTAMLFVFQWYQRSRADHLLAAALQVQPGVTTRSVYMELMKPYTNTAFYGSNTTSNWVMSSPKWWTRIVYFVLPGAAFGDHQWIHDWTMLEPTLFEVSADFRDGRVSSLSFREAQGSGHPVGASVKQLPGHHAEVPLFSSTVFPGYFKFERDWDGGSYVHFFWVTLDDRATPEERRKATEYKFSCFTTVKACRDARRMLMPADSR